MGSVSFLLLCVLQLKDYSRKDIDSLFFCNMIKMTSSRLQVLEADNNSIENLEGVYHLPKLEEVLLKNNSILKSIIHIYYCLFAGERPVLIP